MDASLGLARAALDRARFSRDPRFDGKFFIAVTSTGIYCRPVCPSPNAKKANVRYYATAAAAAEAGFRPCLRCRPEAAPGTPAWLGTSAVVRRALRSQQRGGLAVDAGGEVALRLAFRPPYDWPQVRDFLALRALPGVERVDARGYARTVATDSGHALVCVRALEREDALELRLRGAAPSALFQLCCAARRAFDLAADPARIARAFKADLLLAPLVRQRPGLRIPGAWDPFECSVRAVLGQQVSVAAGRTLAARLVSRLGKPVTTGTDGLTHLFPSPAALAAADLDGLGLTGARAGALRALARAVAGRVLDFAAPLDDVVAALTALPGIGAWTAQYVALRALGEPDALPAADLVLRRMAAAGGAPLTARQLEVRAEAWRPWRGYAVLHLWRSAGTAALPKRRTFAKPRKSSGLRCNRPGNPRAPGGRRTELKRGHKGPLLSLTLAAALVGWPMTPALAAQATPWKPVGISSPQFESHAAFDPRTGDLYFVRSSPAFEGWRILVSSCAASGWSEPKPPAFAGDGVEADPYFTADGSSLYFISTRSLDGVPRKDLDIWRVDRASNGMWGIPTHLPEPVNSGGAEWFPRPAPDGWLYFGSNRPGGLGGNDIWRARADGKGRWSVENLGPTVNTAGEEYEPLPSADGRRLIVMADGSLYETRKTAAGWSPRVKLGADVNVSGTEIGALFSPSGRSLLFSRDTKGPDSGEFFVWQESGAELWPPACPKSRE